MIDEEREIAKRRIKLLEDEVKRLGDELHRTAEDLEKYIVLYNAQTKRVRALEWDLAQLKEHHRLMARYFERLNE